MKKPLVVAGAALLSLATPAFAHQVDEYIQATTISLEKHRVVAQIRLTPGVDVFKVVMAAIDTDGNGVISDAEQRSYAERVLRDLSLAIDGERLSLRLVSWQFTDTEVMKEGRGTIQLELEADVPDGGGNRRLVFQNHHMSRIAAYLVNGLVPNDPDIQVTVQNRNYQQSSYQLDYVQAGVGSVPLVRTVWSSVLGWPGAATLLVLAWLVSLKRRPRPATVTLPNRTM